MHPLATPTGGLPLRVDYVTVLEETGGLSRGQRLGQGGSGEVFRCQGPQLGPDVAVKVLGSNYSPNVMSTVHLYAYCMTFEPIVCTPAYNEKH